MEYLDFKTARCKDCFKCLRECPVKAIKFEGHQAKIMEEKCILCGRCTEVCPQNAKKVHSELQKVEQILAGDKKVFASLAPSFVSSFEIQSFALMREALLRLGFFEVEETAAGAKAVTEEYAKFLRSGSYKNLISSACPAINRMIQLYYPSALQYLAPVASPMVAHARMLRKRYPDCKIVFIGPCIAKKREAAESGIIDGVLTFEELEEFFEKKNINLKELALQMGEDALKDAEIDSNRARFYPISRGIIKAFEDMPPGYEYVAVDGVRKSFEMLNDIASLSGMFIEVNCCEYSCINGPCSIKRRGGALKANEDVRKYVNADLSRERVKPLELIKTDLLDAHARKRLPDYMPTEGEIRAILARTGKFRSEDEINCGACGYSTCREKAIAVANGYADIEMCIPYMRTRAETMSYEVIKNSPNGIIVLDTDYKVIQANDTVCALLGIDAAGVKGEYAFELFDAQEYVKAFSENKNVNKKKVYLPATKKYAELSVVVLSEQKIIFGVYKDITNRIEYDAALSEVKNKTLKTTDEVIKKQMRVAQEIASLLGETTAETKVALLALKRTLQSDEGDGNGTLS
jgi:PAS domain S-box-containing protein